MHVRCFTDKRWMTFMSEPNKPLGSHFAGSAPQGSREHFASRLGFILISAGCAIGLGNIGRFPYITGQYGGAAFILIYLLFLVILGLPVMIMEFSVGRASQRTAAGAFKALAPTKHWNWFGWFSFLGCFILMMFYTVVCGWMLSYTAKICGKNVDFTVTEFRILQSFIEHKNEVLSREQLIEIAYPQDTYLNDRAVDCHIKRLRKKIPENCIETVYGLGYKYSEKTL